LLPADLTVRRGEIIQRMRDSGIALGVHYPAIHQTSLYKRLDPLRSPLPHTEDIAARILTLPLFPAMQESDIQTVASTLSEVLNATYAKGPKT